MSVYNFYSRDTAFDADIEAVKIMFTIMPPGIFTEWHAVGIH